ncbi:hypothetical protein PG1791B_1674 [Bifidobacterium pseudolongum subsp. globosum]|nr:hypothetical protein PG1791B_1674 [Bifidobacterium pseudolongum subsp. globosum]
MHACWRHRNCPASGTKTTGTEQPLRPQRTQRRQSLQRPRAPPKDSLLFRLIAENRVEDVIGGGITYVGEDGWIGFDTGHACDVWPLSPEYYAAQAAKVRAMGEQPYVWTVGKVVEEAERLCERIALAHRTAEALG